MSGLTLFDLELEVLPFAATPKDVIACKTCRRPIPKAERSLMLPWSSTVGYYWTCEPCEKERWQAAYDAERWWECGVHKHYFDDQAHCADCWKCVCPWCGAVESNGWHLWSNHCPNDYILAQGICSFQFRMFKTVAECMECHGWTFGDYDAHAARSHTKAPA